MTAGHLEPSELSRSFDLLLGLFLYLLLNSFEMYRVLASEGCLLEVVVVR